MESAAYQVWWVPGHKETSASEARQEDFWSTSFGSILGRTTFMLSESSRDKVHSRTGFTTGEPRLVYAFIPHKIETLISFSSVGEQGFYYRHIGNHLSGISESGNYCFLRIPQTRLYIKPGCSAHIFSPSLNDALGLHYLSLLSASHPAKCDSLAWRLHT